MRVLVACEYSGAVRDAFIAQGHYAVSCDLLPTDVPGPHYTGDVFDIIDQCWDLMIAHPPCTYLCSSGLHWNKRRPERAQQTEDALGFVRRLMEAGIPRIAIENPIGCIGTRIRPADQTVQPWQFGHDASKATCLWLKNLPLLTHTRTSSLRASWMVKGVGRIRQTPARTGCHQATCAGKSGAKRMQESPKQWRNNGERHELFPLRHTRPSHRPTRRDGPPS